MGQKSRSLGQHNCVCAIGGLATKSGMSPKVNIFHVQQLNCRRDDIFSCATSSMHSWDSQRITCAWMSIRGIAYLFSLEQVERHRHVYSKLRFIERLNTGSLHNWLHHIKDTATTSGIDFRFNYLRSLFVTYRIIYGSTHNRKLAQFKECKDSFSEVFFIGRVIFQMWQKKLDWLYSEPEAQPLQRNRASLRIILKMLKRLCSLQ